MSDKPQQEYICNDDDLGCLYDYMMAAMAGNDILELPRLWNQEIGVIKSRPHTSAPVPEPDEKCYIITEKGIVFLENHCRFDSETDLFQASEILKDTRSREANGYLITRQGLEEYYDALAHINGKDYADRMWNCIERGNPRQKSQTTVQSTDETICALISENARIGAELKQMTKKAEMLSWKHDAQVAKAEREQMLNYLFPKATPKQAKGGWTYEVKFMERLEFRISERDEWTLGLEEIQEVLTVLEESQSEPNPCEENGCTDVENCDEICDHSRIYSPVQVAEKLKAERERVLEQLLYDIDGETGFYVFPHPKATAGNGLSRFVLLDDLTELVESLRQPEPQQEGRR